MDSGNRTRSTVRFLTAAGICTTLLVTAALILTGTVIALVVATPVLVIFSPVIVPAGVVTALAVTGLAVSGGFGVAAVSTLTWVYSYVSGKRPVGSGKVDQVKAMLAEKAKDYGSFVQNKAHDVAS